MSSFNAPPDAQSNHRKKNPTGNKVEGTGGEGRRQSRRALKDVVLNVSVFEPARIARAEGGKGECFSRDGAFSNGDTVCSMQRAV